MIVAGGMGRPVSWLEKRLSPDARGHYGHVNSNRGV